MIRKISALTIAVLMAGALFAQTKTVTITGNLIDNACAESAKDLDARAKNLEGGPRPSWLVRTANRNGENFSSKSAARKLGGIMETPLPTDRNRRFAAHQTLVEQISRDEKTIGGGSRSRFKFWHGTASDYEFLPGANRGLRREISKIIVPFENSEPKVIPARHWHRLGNSRHCRSQTGLRAG